jgi:hypothetical protein
LFCWLLACPAGSLGVRPVQEDLVRWLAGWLAVMGWGASELAKDSSLECVKNRFFELFPSQLHESSDMH